jgi:hypothetical protein
MNIPNNERPPLKNIDKSGSYLLKLIKREEKHFKKNAKGFASVRLFFLDNDGNCLTKNYSTEFGKGLAMVIGKFSSAYAKTPSPEMSIEQLMKYCEPAWGKKATVEVDATQDGEWNGRPQYKYKFTKIESQDAKLYGKPTEANAPEFDAPSTDGGDIQF